MWQRIFGSIRIVLPARVLLTVNFDFGFFVLLLLRNAANVPESSVFVSFIPRTLFQKYIWVFISKLEALFPVKSKKVSEHKRENYLKRKLAEEIKALTVMFSFALF